MKQLEKVYCEILHKVISEHKTTITQKQLSNDCSVSIGIVNYALKPLYQMGIIEKRQRNFIVLNPKKLLLYWASIRNISADIVYKTYSKRSVRDIENTMPPCVFTAYTAYRHAFSSVPADYHEVYVYGDTGSIKDRFPPSNNKLNNIFVLKINSYIEKRAKRGIAPIPLIYVDLWNLNTWYANEFIKEFDKKLRL